MNEILLEHWDEMRLIFSGGKLWSKDGWRNVDEHQTEQLLGAEALVELLGMSKNDRQKLESAACVHDWRKRLDRHPEDFSPEEIEKAEIFLTKVNPDKNLMAATGPDFLEKVLYSAPTFLEFLQFYLDDITKGSEIVPFDERIDEVSARRQDLNEDMELTKRLGGRKYWDLEREIGHGVEKFIFDRLVEKGVNISSQQEIPNLIRSKIKEQING